MSGDEGLDFEFAGVDRVAAQSEFRARWPLFFECQRVFDFERPDGAEGGSDDAALLVSE